MQSNTAESLRKLSWLTQRHTDALAWFHERVGHEIRWPAPLNGMFLANKAKGIHKPAGLEYALSVRQSLTSSYDDALHWAVDGSWYLHYHHERVERTSFTNRAMTACRTAGVPVGVILQIKQKPTPLYRVLGLGIVSEDQAGIFTIRQYGSTAERAEDAIAVQATAEIFNASNLADARRREMRAIALRRGQPAFRSQVLDAYGGACAISGCRTSTVLEAAHIIPYRGEHTNHVCNGILLRSDLHTLFDVGLLQIQPKTFTVLLAEGLAGSEYSVFQGKRLTLPQDVHCWPDRGALEKRFDDAMDPGISTS